MTTLSLKERLLRHLLRTHGWISSGELQRLVVQHTKFTPRTAVRRLQELQEEGFLEREIRKGHAWYRAKDGVEMPKEQNPDFIPGVGVIRDMTHV